MKHRNTKFLFNESNQYYKLAIENCLMQVNIKGRKNKIVTMPNGQEVVEFINCSYLGLDLYPKVVEASKNIDKSWGINFCCARSRFSIEPIYLLENELSRLFRGRAIVFPSVTTTHISVMPLISSGILLNPENPPKVRMIFDKFAHSSMQYLKPILANEATVETIAHNSLKELREQVKTTKAEGETAVYVADGIYSMGGLCPINELLAMAKELNFYIYLDDAHGTSIFGERGEGSVMGRINSNIPKNLFIAFCLSKGFGCNGGGILLPDTQKERLVRTFGQIYAFSAALDFSIVGGCLAAVEAHKDGTVKRLQKHLRDRVALFDELMGIEMDFSPIRMVMVGNEYEAMELAKRILADGFFVSVVFFPIVPREKAQLRICIAANHTEEQIKSLVGSIQKHSSLMSIRAA